MLSLSKFVTVFGSMSLFVLWESKSSGLAIATGIAVCIFIHELGHVVMNVRHGIRASAPMFIPFVGALIAVKEFPEDPTAESESAAGGPVAGLLAALVCLLIYGATSQSYWLSLAHLGFVINFFNLLPFPPLDGSRIASAFSPGNWDFVLFCLLLVALKAACPPLWGILVAGFAFRLGRRSQGRHNLASPRVRLRMSLIYVALCLVLSFGVEHSTVPQTPPAALAQRQTSTQPEGAASPLVSVSPTPQSSPTPIPQSATEKASIQAFMVATAIFGLTILGLLLGGWWLMGYLLARAAGEKLRATHLLYPTGLTLLGLGLVLFPQLDFTTRSHLGLAYAAALVGALAYAGYHAYHDSGAQRRAHIELLQGALRSGALGALAVAYTFNSLTVAGLVAVLAISYLGLHSYLVPLTWASGLNTLGSLSEANRYRQKALKSRPPAPIAESVSLDTARTYLALGDGLGAREQASQVGSSRDSLAWTYLRAQACLSAELYDLMLDECQRILREPGQELAVRCLLAHLANQRNWPEEALAQADYVLSSSRNDLESAWVVTCHIAKARALLALGRWEEALKCCDQGRLWATRPDQICSLWVTSALAQLELKQPDLAARLLIYASRRMPESLEVAYAEAKLKGQTTTLVGDNYWSRRTREI